MIAKGSNVKIHYTLQVDDQVVDSSRDKEPFSYTQGSGQILKELENQLEGREEGDQVSVELTPEDGYGKHDPNAVHSVPMNVFDDPEAVKVGSEIGIKTQDGATGVAIVKEMTEEEVTLDLNHPLAGKTLQFDVEIIEVA
jgi:FKBP-type peptidyl-prolyl cis-trans isomerase 2